MRSTLYSDVHRKLVQKLKAARLHSGLSQNQAAKALNRSQSAISKIESGQLRVEIILLKKLARVYKQDIRDFL